MSKKQRVLAVFRGLASILCGAIFLTNMNDSYPLLMLLVSCSLLIYGIQQLAYYFTMARHMVGGRMLFYRGMILLDFGIFTGSMADIPPAYITLYLLFGHAMSGVYEVFGALEGKRQASPGWKLKFGQGVLNMAIAIGCLFFIRKPTLLSILYGTGLIYSGLSRIVAAFRRTAIPFLGV